MIAYCGINCEECKTFIATKKNDDNLRKQVAEEWSKMYNADIKPEHINCTGCKGDGIKFSHCENGCEIRKCAMPKKIKNCTQCSEYVCSKLKEMFKIAPELEGNLKKLEEQ